VIFVPKISKKQTWLPSSWVVFHHPKSWNPIHQSSNILQPTWRECPSCWWACIAQFLFQPFSSRDCLQQWSWYCRKHVHLLPWSSQCLTHSQTKICLSPLHHWASECCMSQTDDSQILCAWENHCRQRCLYLRVWQWKDVTAGHESIGPKLDSYETEVKN